ncbi:MAG: prepilin-type N-terminal cleavage/methylation domain-containing protein [Parcubacteria group bacterium]
MKNHTMNNWRIKNCKKGFTLIELMVSIFIFLIIMTAIVGIFARQIQAYRNARVSQNDLENAQFAMNYMAKTLRTATVLGRNNEDLRDPAQFASAQGNTDDFSLLRIDGSNKLVLYDFSQELCMRFYFATGEGRAGSKYDDSALWVESMVGIGFDQIEECTKDATYVPSSPDYKLERLTSGYVTGKFWTAPTRYMDQLDSQKTDTIGRVTIGMSVLPSSTNILYEQRRDQPIYIQTSVSLRDYPPDLSF